MQRDDDQQDEMNDSGHDVAIVYHVLWHTVAGAAVGGLVGLLRFVIDTVHESGDKYTQDTGDHDWRSWVDASHHYLLLKPFVYLTVLPVSMVFAIDGIAAHENFTDMSRSRSLLAALIISGIPLGASIGCVSSLVHRVASDVCDHYLTNERMRDVAVTGSTLLCAWTAAMASVSGSLYLLGVP